MESLKSSPPPLAQHIRDLRLASNMTLAELEQASTISRASLSRIENGEVSPTADTLAKLSSAFGLPISRIIAPLEHGFDALVRRADQTTFHDPSHGFTRRSVSPPNPHLRLEIIEGTLAPSARIAYDGPTIPGQEHHVVLFEGSLGIEVEGTTHHLSPGDCLRFRLNGTSTYHAGPNGARYLLVLA